VKTKRQIKKRLEYLRGKIKAECISEGEIVELQSLAEHIEDGDVELLQWAGIPEFEPEIYGVKGNWRIRGDEFDYIGIYKTKAEARKMVKLIMKGKQPPMHDSMNDTDAAKMKAQEILRQTQDALLLFLDQYWIPGDSEREARPEVKAALRALALNGLDAKELWMIRRASRKGIA
jgi:hypothetical protein